jgi:hypothetical protein
MAVPGWKERFLQQIIDGLEESHLERRVARKRCTNCVKAPGRSGAFAA